MKSSLFKFIICPLIIVSLTLFAIYPANAQKVIIRADSSEWVAYPLTFCHYTDLITLNEDVVAKTVTNKQGGFVVELELETTTYLFARMGVYLVYLFAAPGNLYEVVLPPQREKSEGDMLNPYFAEEHTHLGIINLPADNINNLFRMFNDTYNPYYNKHVEEAFADRDFASLDEDIARMEKPFYESNDQFFRQYRTFRYAFLRYLALQHRVKGIAELFFTGSPVLYHNPAYMDLFHLIFDNYFQYHGLTSEGGKIYTDINTNRDYFALKETLRQNPVLINDTLLHMVMLKGLFDEFYDDRFSRNGILEILDTIIESSGIDEIERIACTVRSRITRLLAGYDPPPFQLHDLDSNLVNIEQFRGKYVYLNFCATSSYTCLKEFAILKNIADRQKQWLTVVTISADPLEASLRRFLQRNRYTWVFLYYGNQPEVIREYDIRNFPTYFLIDPTGKLVMSPAPSPEEHFEQKFFEMLRSKGIR